MSKVGTAFEAPEGEDEAAKKFVPVWQQDVRDEEGRRRFHGAFTGGFSAGYYNTVGSKEGWTPATFTSSRAQRAERVVAAPQQFMDAEDYEGAGVGGRALSSRIEYDVFASRAPASGAGAGAGAGESALASLLAAPRDSIGAKLLRLMGWREGRRIGPRKALAPPPSGGGKKVYGVSLADLQAPEEDDAAAEAAAAAAEAPVAVLSFKTKSDTFGLGFDPHSAAPELRAVSARREAEREAAGRAPRPVLAMAAAVAGGRGAGVPQRFGLGALEKAEGPWSAEAYDQAEIAYDRVIHDGADDDREMMEGVQPAGGKTAAQRALSQLVPDDTGVAPREAQKGRDGRAPLRRFRLAERHALAVKAFATPPMPRDFVPRHTIARPRAEAARSTTAAARADLLGEAALPDRSAPPPPAAPPAVRGGLLSAAERDRLLALAGGGGGGQEAKRATDMARIGGVMASRFVTAGAAFSSTATVAADGNTGRAESQAEAAARSGMYGKFTRAEEPWRPERLLCKRWNVRDPWAGRDDAPKTEKERQAAQLEALVAAASDTAAALAAPAPVDLAAAATAALQVEEAERRADGSAAAAAPAEPARPSIDLFKAIFADDDDDSPLLAPLVPPPAPKAAAAAPPPAPASQPVAPAPPTQPVPPPAPPPSHSGGGGSGGPKRPRAADFM